VYSCALCDVTTTVTKRIADIDREERCPHCAATMCREVQAVNFTGHRNWDCTPHDPVFGCRIESHAHRKRLAKERGMIEIGNETVDKMEKHNSKLREDKRELNWANADREMA
jgi:hypothetical protein